MLDFSRHDLGLCDGLSAPLFGPFGLVLGGLRRHFGGLQSHLEAFSPIKGGLWPPFKLFCPVSG